LHGHALAPGIGSAAAVLLKGRAPLPRRFAAGRKDAKREAELFREARRQVEAELRSRAERSGDAVAAGILKAQLAILRDPTFGEQVSNRIVKGKLPAGAAIEKTAAGFAALMQRSPSAYLRERAADLRDIAFMLGEKLFGKQAPRRASLLPRGKSVVVADVLSPSELLACDRRRLRGLVLGQVGPTSHTAILARTLGIPAVSLPNAALASVPDGAELIVDGRRGLALVRPGAPLKRYYRLEEEHQRRLGQRRSRIAAQPATTRDGVRLEVAANIAGPAEAGAAWKNGAEGIGLFRSEFLFLDREAPPSEEEQYQAYSQAARSAGKRRIIFRTLDVGGDKPLPYLGLPREENPFLGNRAVRFYDEHADLIRCQLRALLRATGRSGHLKIMVPMVAAVGEVRLVRRLLQAAAGELRERNVPSARHVELGIMIETPAAALVVDSLAREVEFFSVGSNDLLQYTMAVDRGHPALAGLYDPLQPAFLRLLTQAAAQARKARRWLGICGEMAGNTELLPLLVGIGFDELSMVPAAIPAVKERLAHLDKGECRSLLRRALRCGEAAEVAALLGEFNGQGTAPAASGPELVRLDSPCRTPAEAIKELCGMLELAGRISDSPALEEAVWKREETFATDLGFGFALPHGKSPAVRAATVTFLRPRRPIRWSAASTSPVKGVLLIAVPEKGGEEHLRLIAGLSRRLMHEEFRADLLSARSTGAVLAALRACLEEK
ncbi:MAG: phosphoenolpyruvate--protein phosphotransferase, partial [Acidobacteria bacterium]|nr:phosphoenolpyruvate--protein phosphotransferase [Acidobacteriota bacterium]